MSDKYLQYVGSWIKLNCKTFSCSGKIESIKPDKIILSNSTLGDDMVSTRFIGIDAHLIESMDFIPSPIGKGTEHVKKASSQQAVNVYTSESRPPSIRRGGPSSAVSRNLNRQKSVEKLPKVRNLSFSDFNCESIKSNINKNVTNEPAWFRFSPEDMATDFDFDKNLALFDKGSIVGNSKKCSNESSDSSDSANAKLYLNSKKKNQILSGKSSKSLSINFDPEDFSNYDNNNHLKSLSGHLSDSSEINRDILSAFKNIGVIPSSADYINKKEIKSTNDQKLAFYHNFFHQPDLVREIEQKKLIKNDVLRRSCRSLIVLGQPTIDFPGFSEFWNLANESNIPVFTTKQRDILFETASQLGIENNSICETIGSTIGEFVFVQVELHSRINGRNANQAPKIAVLLGKCTASVYAISVANYLLKRGCFLTVYVDENKISDINYRINFELLSLVTLLSRSSSYNVVTEKVEDLGNKTFDYVISGVESDSSPNQVNFKLKQWCMEQPVHILCINPPKISYLKWKSAVFVGVPTVSQANIADKGNVFNASIGSNKSQNQAKSEELILLCNCNLVQRVFSFLKLDYQSPFVTKNLVRLYRDDHDLCFVE